MNWLWIVFAYLNLFIAGLSENIRGPIFPDFLQQFSLTHSQGAWFFSVASFSMMAGAYLASILIEKRGVMFSLFIFTLSLIIGLSGFIFALGFVWMLVFAVFFGLALGGAGVTQNITVLEGSRSEILARVQSGLQSCYGASSLLAPGLVMLVTFWGGSWNQSFIPPLILAVGLIIALWIFNPDIWHQQALAKSEQVIEPQERGRFFEFYWGFILALYISIEILVSSRLALLLRHNHGHSPESGSFWTSVFFTGLFVGRLILSFYQIPLRPRHQLLLFCSAALVLFVLGLAWDPLFLAFIGLALSGFYPVWMTSLSELFPRRMAKVAAIGVGLSGITVVLMHTAVGQVSDQWGLSVGYALGPLLTGICALLILFSPAFWRTEAP